MFKHSLKYAAICGIFLTIIYHISYLMGSNPLIDISHLIFDLILFGLFIFFTQKEFKTYLNDGYLHFWQGMTIGFLVYTLSTVIFAILLAVYMLIKPAAVDAYITQATNFLVEKSATYIEQFSEEDYQIQLEKIKVTTMWELVLSASIKKLIAGFFITPVISIILRRQPK